MYIIDVKSLMALRDLVNFLRDLPLETRSKIYSRWEAVHRHGHYEGFQFLAYGWIFKGNWDIMYPSNEVVSLTEKETRRLLKEIHRCLKK